MNLRTVPPWSSRCMRGDITPLCGGYDLHKTVAGTLADPVSVAIDSTGNAYVLEAGTASGTADLLLLPAGGGTPQVVIPQGAGLLTPSALAIDSAGNFLSPTQLTAPSRDSARMAASITTTSPGSIRPLRSTSMASRISSSPRRERRIT